MSRVFVSNHARTVSVEVVQDQVEGNAAAACGDCPWTTEPGRADSLEDVVNEASIHLDLEH